jgi:hypothetical protein
MNFFLSFGVADINSQVDVGSRGCISVESSLDRSHRMKIALWLLGYPYPNGKMPLNTQHCRTRFVPNMKSIRLVPRAQVFG